MIDEIFLDNTRYVAAHDAAHHANLSRDYVARLCRNGKIRGRQIGKTWYVDTASLDSYLINKSYEETKRHEALSKERALDYAAAQGGFARSETKNAGVIHHVPIPSPHTLRRQGLIGRNVETPVRASVLATVSTGASDRSRALLEKTLSNAQSSVQGFASDAIARTATFSHSLHHPIDAASTFIQKVAALALSLSLTFGTYAFVDKTYALFAVESIRSIPHTVAAAASSIVSGEAYNEIKQSSSDFYSSFADATFGERKEYLASAASSFSESLSETLRTFARGTSAVIDSVIFGIAFPIDGIGPDPRAAVTLKVLPKQIDPSTHSTTTVRTALNQTVVNQPVIERILERERIVTESGVSGAYVDERLNGLENKIMSEMYRLSAANTTTSVQTIQVIGQATRIDRLDNVSINNSTFSNGSINSSNVNATSLSATNATTTTFAVTGSATSTFAGGIDISSGCVAVNGTCITGGGGGGGTPGGSDTQVQFNDNGAFAGDSGLTYSSSTDTLSATNIVATLSTTTSATSTNFFATLGRFTTGVISTLTSAAATITDLVATTLNVSGQTTLSTASSTAISALDYVAVGRTATTTIRGDGVASVIPYASSTAISASYASSTNAFFGSLSLGSLTGVLKATAGTIATGLVNLASEVTGILPVANGGTGWSNLQANTVLIGNGTGSVATTSAGTNGQVLALVAGTPTWVATTTLSTISGTLGPTQGGTGLSSFTTGDILYADGANSLARLPIGSAGQVLKVTGGVPVWGADQTSGGGGGAGAFATTSDSLAIYPADTSDVVIIGTSATVTPSSILEVTGSSYFSGNVGIGTTSPWRKLSVVGSSDLGNNALAGSFTATSTTASVFPYASTTAISASYASSTSAFIGSLSVGALTGLVRAASGVISAITTSAGIAAEISDETGTGALVFGTSPTISAPTLTGLTTLTNASSTLFSSSYASSTNAFFGSLSLGSLTGVLKATAGTVATGLVNLTSEVTGTLPIANGGTGATSLSDLITLGTHTTGNFIATITGTANQITVSGSGSENAGVTLSLPSQLNLTNASTSAFSSNSLAVGGTGTTSIATDGTLTTPSLVVGTLTGLLRAASGVVSAITTSAGIAAEISDETGSGALVFGTSPTIDAPTLTGNTTLANATSTNFFSSRLTALTAAFGGTASTTVASDGTLTTPSIVIGSLSGLLKAASGVVSAITTSADIASTISDETGTGALVFATSPTIDAPTLTGLTTLTNASSTQLTVSDKFFFANSSSDTPLTGAHLVAGGGWWGIRSDSSSRFNIDFYNNGSPASLFSMSQIGDLGVGTTSQAGTSLLLQGNGQATTLLNVRDYTESSALTVSGTGFATTTVKGLNINGSATSTSNVGFNITTGCYAVNGTCISGGSGGGLTSADIDTSAEIAAIVGDETGSGALVFGTAPTISGANLTGNTTLANATSTNFFSSRLTALTAAFGGTASTTVASDGALSTPSLVIGSLSGLLKAASGIVSAITTSADIASTISDETGTGSLVFSASPTFTGTTNFASLNTTGNVGVGTSSPYSRLTAWGGSTGNIFEAVTNASSSALTVSATGFGTTTVTGLNITGSATSTSNVGINLTGGCFAINGTCVGGGGGGLASTDIDTSAEIAAIVGDETGSGALVFGTSPTLSGATLNGNTTLANATSTNFYTTTFGINSEYITDLTGTGLTITGGALTFNTQIIDTSSELAAILTDETGTGNVVFSASPTFTGTASFAALNTSGNVGVGTSTPYARLTVWGAGTGTGTLAEFVNNASTTIAKFLDNGTGYFLGNIGVGTTSPYTKLSVANGASAAQLSLSYDATTYTELQTTTVGDFVLNPSGGDARLLDDNFWVCTGGTCPTSNPTGTGNLIVGSVVGIGTTTGAIATPPKLTIATQDSTTDFLRIASTTDNSLFLVDKNGNVGVGTSTPTKQLSLSKLLFVGGGNPSAAGTATSTFQGDVLITGKLDVSTIDPVYTIDGTKYATYGLSSIGVKEEMATTITLSEKNKKTGKYEYAIAFNELEEGSDLWLFYQVTEFGAEWQNLVVTATPGFESTVSYRKDVAARTLYVASAAAGEVSLRLIADRFDAHTWPNLRPDQEGGFKGFEISSKRK